MANSCPLGNNSKPISIIDNNMLRKDGNGTSMVLLQNIPLLILRLCLIMLHLT
jgi:hypothetical protein